MGFSKFPGAGGASSDTFLSGVVRPTEERRRKRPLRQLTTADGDVTDAGEPQQNLREPPTHNALSLIYN